MTLPAPLAVTMGEPAGIGGELSLKAWAMRRRDDRPFFVLDDAARLAALARKLGLDVPVRPVDRPDEARQVFETALPVLPVRLRAGLVASDQMLEGFHASCPALVYGVGVVHLIPLSRQNAESSRSRKFF